MNDAVVRIRWALDVVDKGAGKDLLKVDRSLRSAVEKTDKAMTARARTAQASERTLTRALESERRAQERAARAAQTAQRATEHLGRSSSTTAATINRGNTSLNERARAYERVGRQADQASRREESAARRSRGAGSVGSRIGGGSGAAAGLAGGLASRVGGLALGVGVGVGLAAAGRDAIGFEKQMAAVQARLLATGADFRRLSNFALELGAKTQFSAGQAAAAMDELAAQGFSVNQIFKVLPGTLNLAAASGTDLASAAQIQTATLRGFGLAADQAGRVADVLAQTANRSAVDMSDLGETLKYIAPVAKATGQSFESMLAAVGLMGNVGIKGSQAGTTLRTALVRLTNPTNKATDALDSLGINAEKLRGPKGLLPLPVILGKIVKGAQGVDKGTRNAALATIFGREALSGMVALVEGGPKKYARMQRALEHSTGAASRAAKIMRNTVAGAWDNFSGSVETAAIKLTRGFMPALKGALNAGAGLVNRFVADAGRIPGAFAAGQQGSGQGYSGIAGRVADVSRRLPHLASAPAGLRAGLAGRSDSETAGFSGVGKIAVAAGRTLRTVGQAAATAGKQLLDAFKPAMPFLRNVLLPLLIGIGKGVLSSLVAAFKVAVPIIKILATVLGAVGTAARPFRGLIMGIGTVIGFVAAGPILKFVAGIGKLGGLFRLVAAPIRLAGAALSGIGRLIGGIGGRILGPVRGAFSSVIGYIAGLGGRFAKTGLSIVGKIASPFARLGHSIAEKVRGILGDVVGFFGRVGKAIVDAIVGAIKSAPGAIAGAVKSITPGPVRSIAKHAPIVGRLFKRRGGMVQRFAAGGMVVGAMLSPGEALAYPGGGMGVVPGRPEARDSVYMPLPVGTGVLTFDGQRRLASGASLSSAIANQAPHFRAGGTVLSPGQMASLAYARGHVRPAAAAVRMGAIGMRESAGRPWIHNYDPPRDDSWGLWQINVLPRANPQYRSWNLTSPDVNARAMGQLFRRAHFAPWGGYPESSYSRWLPAAKRGFRRDGRGLPSSVSIPIHLGRSHTRAGLVDDALSQGLEAGAAGLTRAEIARATAGGRGARRNPIIDAIRQAGTATTRQIKLTRPTTRRGSLGRGGASLVAIGHLAQRRGFHVGEHPAFGGVHGGHSRTSLHYRGRAIDVTGPLGRLGTFAQYVSRTQGGRLAEEYWRGPKWVNIKNGNRVGFNYPGALAAPDGHKRHVHVAMRRGGTIGGRLGSALKGALTFKAGTFNALDATIGAAAEARLEQLRAGVLRQVRAGGAKKVVDRLRGVLDLIDFEIGRRIGEIGRRIERRSAGIERGQGGLDRAMRRRGVDATSSLGLGLQIGQDKKAEIARRANVRDAQRALTKARKTGSRETIDAAAERLQQARADLDEALTVQVEHRRDLFRQLAQDRVDTAQFGLDKAQGALAGLDVNQRLAGTADTGLGMAQKAAAIQATLLPALVANRDALQVQFQTLVDLGDTSGARQAFLAVQQAGTDIAGAMADAADLVRQGAERVAQDLVDAATHNKTMADLGLQRLELEQRIAGTYDAGGAQRADYINKTLIPALNAELAALQNQINTANQQGDPVLADQIAEAIGQKQNDILQATLDATEQVVSNTEPRKYGGTLGFTYGDDSWTDDLTGS